MPQTDEVKAEGSVFWVTSNPAGSRDLVETTARGFKLGVQFCAYTEVIERLRSAPCVLVGIEFDGGPDQALTVLKEVHQRLPHLTILAASSDGSDAMIRAALEAGASDFLSLPLNRLELHKALIKFTQVEVKPVAARGNIVGEVYTICGARGGLGVTTLAVNLAVRMASLTGSEVALVDLDLQRGDVAAFLNLTPLQSLATIAAAHGELDAVFLRGTLTRHTSGVFVLPAPPQIEDVDSIGHAEIDRTLSLLRTQFRYTVIDTPRTITGATMAAFEQTDRIFVLTDLSVPGVRSAQRTFELLGRLGIPTDRVQLVVTEALPGPVSVADAVRAIGKQPFFTIPRDESAASKAMNAGTPLNGAVSGLAESIDALAAKLAGLHETPKSRPLLQRIFSKGARP
jgi:pilus assembly protein CpaE